MKSGILIAAAAFLLVAAKGADSVDDPYLWLEDVHGAKPLAWVAEQNERTRGVLKGDPRYQPDHDAVLKVLDATDRIPLGGAIKNYVFNFWQDAANPKGVWRRTTIADYNTPSPKWETLLDVDKLAADEHENWIWEGASCTPELDRCLIQLSRDGGDAHVFREFDLKNKSFFKDGFTLPNAKSSADYIDDNTILLATDFGPGTLTKSGYPRIIKIWHRGQPVDAAKTLLEGKPEDIAVGSLVLDGPDFTYALLSRSPTFFDNEYFHVTADGTFTKLPLPLYSEIKGRTGDQLVFTIRKDWTVGGRTYGQGSLLSASIASLEPTKTPDIQILYTPGPRSTVETVSPGRDAVYASIFDNVTGSGHAFRFNDGKWLDSKLDLPANGATDVVSTNDFGPEAYFT